jgi:hypothetical protein
MIENAFFFNQKNETEESEKKSCQKLNLFLKNFSNTRKVVLKGDQNFNAKTKLKLFLV